MYLLDTNVIIDYCNSKLPIQARVYIEKLEPAISFITVIELFAGIGISKEEKTILEKFVELSLVYDKIGSDIIDTTIKIRIKSKAKLPDCIIAATAIVHNLVLLTRNVDDFKNIEGLHVINPHIL
ncbi:MAG: type II toxin-antitoxin system VapC family toxin [Opitutaceae bacterium]|nr:type II toxin-antitoxin system VapC family toxin [Cytophagales bacterium]